MSSRRLALGTIAMGVANVLKVGIQLVMLPIMARLLGPSDYGLYSLAMPIVLFVMMLADGGLGASLAREEEQNHSVWSSAFWALLISGIAMAGIVIAWSFIFAAFAGEPRLPPIMIALSPCLIFFVLSVPAYARLMRQARLEIAPLGDALGGLVGAACAIFLALHHAGAWSLVAQSFVTYLIRFLVATVAAPVIPRFHLSFSELSPHLMMGGTIVGGKLADAGDRSIENALMGRNFGSIELGAFSLANQISRFINESVSNALWATLYAQTIGALSDEEVRNNYRNIVRLLALLLFPIAALAAAQGDQLVKLLLGDRWSAVSPMLQVLLISGALSIVGTLGNAVLYAKGLARVLFRVTIETAAIRIVFVTIAPWTGIDGLIAGLAASYCYMFWRSLSQVCSILHVRYANVFEQVRWPALSAAIVGALCALASRSSNQGIFPMMISLFLSFLAYFLLLLLFERKKVLDDFGRLTRILRRGSIKAAT